jgi:hypothetical protein
MILAIPVHGVNIQAAAFHGLSQSRQSNDAADRLRVFSNRFVVHLRASSDPGLAALWITIQWYNKRWY